VEEYRAIRGEVERRVGRLNGRYATLHNSPIHFIHRPVAFPELCALYAVADVALVTPLIDGMNLVAKAYVACQRDEPGVLVLSEFAGAASELFNATLVNPYDAQEVARSLDAALATPAAERRRLMEPMRQSVMAADARQWARRFLHDLGAAAAPPRRPRGTPPGGYNRPVRASPEPSASREHCEALV
jgi:trehalose-6-phosphate synthase